MKTERNIFIAFVLNLFFSIFEIIGGIFTGSIAIISDAIHDFGDAMSIGISYFLEKKSKKQPDDTHTYGYMRYSVVGSVITTTILIIGSVVVIYNAINRILNPAQINYNGMIVFAVVGVCVNFCAAWFTKDGDSLNQKAVNLHMLEDVLGWAIVLVGAVVMRFTDFSIIDPILSIGVAVFIFIHAVKTLKSAIDLFLVKTPKDIDVSKIKDQLTKIAGVLDVHHIHVWSMDGQSKYATMHVVTDADAHTIKHKIRDELKQHGIVHATLELESADEHCHDTSCHVDTDTTHTHHHHH